MITLHRSNKCFSILAYDDGSDFDASELVDESDDTDDESSNLSGL